jgi:hypothetical protein
MARAVRGLCTISTLFSFLAGVVFGIVTTKPSMLLIPQLSLSAAVHNFAALDSLARLGLPPWMLALGLGALIVTVALREADRDPPLRF